MTRVLIVEARFYDDISDALFKGAAAVLSAEEIEYDRVTVMGALEIPGVIGYAMRASDNGNLDDPFDGFLALGCVIRGETSHYDIVAGESARGLMDLSLRYGVAVANGILTTDNKAQALARARPEEGDKGGFAAKALIGTMQLRQAYRWWQ